MSGHEPTPASMSQAQAPDDGIEALVLEWRATAARLNARIETALDVETGPAFILAPAGAVVSRMDCQC